MFKVGDRVRILNTTGLIEEVRGQAGTVRIAVPLSTTIDGDMRQSMYIELDNGARPRHTMNEDSAEGSFYLFGSRHVRLLAPREPDWEV